MHLATPSTAPFRRTCTLAICAALAALMAACGAPGDTPDPPVGGSTPVANAASKSVAVGSPSVGNTPIESPALGNNGADGETPSVAIDSDRCAANRAAGTIHYISPFGFHAGAGVLDVFAAEKLGYFDALCLDVAFITHATNSSSLVSSNTAQVTNIGSAADLMNGISNGANLVGVATYGDTSNYTILTVPEITTLQQVEGKSLAYHGVLPIVLKQMLRASGANLSSITFVLSNSYDPNQLFGGNFGALQAYRSNEPILLRAEGRKFNEFVPSDFGVSGTFNIQTFNGDFLREHRRAAADFMRAELHAFDYCAAHQSECVTILGDYAADSGVTFDSDHAAAVWKFEAALALAHTLPGMGVGVQTAAQWQPELTMMNQILDQPLPDLKTFQDVSLTAGLYDGTDLIWP